jgi:hypothetical protein
LFGQADLEKKMLKLTNNKEELPMTAMSVNKSGRNVQLYKGLSILMLPTKSGLIWPRFFKGEDSNVKI